MHASRSPSLGASPSTPANTMRMPAASQDRGSSWVKMGTDRTRPAARVEVGVGVCVAVDVDVDVDVGVAVAVVVGVGVAVRVLVGGGGVGVRVRVIVGVLVADGEAVNVG